MRPGSTRLLILTVVFTVFLLAAGNLLLEWLKHRKERPATPPPPVQREIPPEPQEVQPPPLEPRAFELTGRVVGPALKAMEGLEVSCGAEAARTDAGGLFRFPASRRGGPLAMTVRRGTEELARWPEVFVGEAASTLLGQPVVSRAARVRWSIQLGDRESAGKVKPSEPGKGDRGALIGLEALLVEDWGPAGRVQISGWSRLPEGAHVYTAVYFEDERIFAGAEPAEARGGKFQLAFPLPESLHLYSTRYDLRFYFATSMENLEQVEGWQKASPDLPWSDLADYQVSIPVYIGLPEEEEADDRRIQAQFCEYLKAARRMKSLLEEQSGETLKLAKGWDPALLESREEVRRAAWLPHGAADPQGGFLEANWRRFLDEEWRPAVRRLLERYSQTKENKHPKAAARMEKVFKTLLDLSQMTSALLYGKFGLPAHAEDFYQDEEGYGGDRALLLKRLEEDLKTLDRYCLPPGAAADSAGSPDRQEAGR
ncbi:MAG: hypothetical protein HY717_08895 [Planctomycetes bacterium]|nr:hypothetical protein [Planctomycetota bacterium]